MVQHMPAYDGEMSTGATGQIPTGVVTFEEASECFDGNMPKGRYYPAYVFLWITIVIVFLGVYIHSKGNYVFETILWLCSFLCFGLFLFIRFGFFGRKIVDTPYGSILCSIFFSDLFISFPKLDYETGKVSWSYFIYSSPLALCDYHNKYRNIYIESIKRNPTAWLKHQFYRELESECLEEIKSIPNSSHYLRNRWEWYNLQKDKYYNLFTQSV